MKNAWFAAALGSMVMALCVSACAPRSESEGEAGSAPDLALVNGRIITVDGRFSIAEAVAVRDGRILAVGKSADIRKLLGTTTRVIDLEGKTVLPGIHDAHVHGSEMGTLVPPLAIDVSPRAVSSVEEIVQRVAGRVKTAKPGEWIRGAGLDFKAMKPMPEGARYPTRALLDAVAPDNPVYLGTFEAFADPVVWVNSKALELAKITRSTKPVGNYPGEEIVKNAATGEPTGIITGFASTTLVTRVLPEWTHEQWKQGLLGAVAVFNAQGITSVMEGALPADMIRLYTELHNEGRLNLRVTVLQEYSPRMVNDLHKLREGMAAVGTSRGFGDEYLRMAGVKYGIDNIPNNKSGWFHDDYVGGGNGQVTWAGKDTEERVHNYAEMVEYAHHRGFQVGTHATGDQAIDTVVDEYIAVEKAEPRGLRHYIIHGDFVPVADAERMAANNIGVSAQPGLGRVIADLMSANVGAERMQRFQPLRSLIDRGVHVAGGSDAPVIFPDWKEGVQFAVTRETAPTGAVLNASEALSIEQAIRMYTIEAAWQDHAEDVRGSIEPGKLADFCVLDKDILGIDPHQIKGIRTLMTLVGGRVVYDATKN
ncbi:MAG: amidohydrolase [Steroidobacteraceae bacterium]